MTATEPDPKDDEEARCHFVLEDGDQLEVIETQPGEQGLDLEVISELMLAQREQVRLSCQPAELRS